MMQTAMELAQQRRERRNRKRLRDHFRSIMDCGNEGCGECRVCRHYAFEEYVSAVAPRDVPCSVSYDQDVLRYLAAKNR